MLTKNAYACVAFLSALAHLLTCENVTPPSRQRRANIYQIAEFHLNLIGLMARADGTHDYASFMDDALLGLTNYFFARIRGFALDETQARQWEEAALRFFRYFVLRTIVVQGSALLDAHFVELPTNLNAPHTLLEQCARRVVEHTARHFNEEFVSPPIDEAIVLYELIHMTNLHIIAVSRDAAPYFQLRLMSPAPYKFFDDNQPSTSAALEPVPYAPLDNYIREWERQRNVYENLNFKLLFQWLNDGDEQAVNYICPTVLSYSSTHFSEFLALHNTRTDRANKMGQSVIASAFSRILVQFLCADYKFLACHPIYERYVENDMRAKQLVDEVSEAHRHRTRQFHVEGSLWRLVDRDYLNLVVNFEEFLVSCGVVARYTRCAPFILLRFLPPPNEN